MVSILIPCYNCGGFISRAIESVLHQTYSNWELLLINNNSVDNTQEVLELYKSKYPDKIFVFEEKKKGAPAARNKGLKNAKGTWIQYLDADDELLPGKIEHQVLIGQKDDADVVIGNAELVEKINGKVKKTLRPLHKEDVWIGLTTSQLGITSAILWKKHRLEKIKGWDEALTSSQEYDLMFRLLASGGKVVFDDRVNTLIHKSDSTISKDPDKSKMIRIIDTRVNLRMRVIDYLKSSNQLTRERKAMIHKYIYLELIGNQINVKEYESKKLNGLVLEIPMQMRLDNFLNSKKRKMISNIKSLLPGFK